MIFRTIDCLQRRFLNISVPWELRFGFRLQNFGRRYLRFVTHFYDLDSEPMHVQSYRLEENAINSQLAFHSMHTKLVPILLTLIRFSYRAVQKTVNSSHRYNCITMPESTHFSVLRLIKPDCFAI